MSADSPSPPFEDPAFFRQAVELGLDVVLLLNGEGRIVYENPAIERLLGYPVEQRLQMSAFDLMHPDDMPAVREALGRVVSGAVDALTMEVRFLSTATATGATSRRRRGRGCAAARPSCW